MKITASDLKVIVNDLQSHIVHNHMSNITIINSHDLFISFSMYRNEKLLISLHPNNPFVCLTKIDNPCGTKISNLNDVLRKEVKDGFINSIETLNNDRIIAIHFQKTNDYFDKEDKTLILELIPHRPNLILVDDNNKILFATHYTDINNPHPILKNIIYSLPNNENTVIESSFDLSTFKNEACYYYLAAINKRLEEQYKPVITHIKSRIKTQKQKIKVLDHEIEEAKNKLSYQDIGNTILVLANDNEELSNYLKDNDLSYDDHLTPGVNAGKYFTKFKKAKRTIEIDEQEKNKTLDEISRLEEILLRFEYLNEIEIAELANELFPHKFKQNSKKKIESKPTSIEHKGIKISFGKNAKQNEELTFKKSNKDDLFFHVKDSHGAHVVVHSSNVDKETILFACEITLLLSGKEGGEVQSAEIRNVKKGSFKGQALLTSYESYIVNKIREETKRLLRSIR